ncbi:EamA family transporter [Halobellus salinisoli]|uniref:EamA family transporter n=1 Tax=Halobellus salinisoli TaxID=3108500 RepID=UPI003008BDDA
MVSTGIALAFGSLLLFGGWAVAAGLATRSISTANAVFLSYVASIGVAGAYVLAAKQPITGTRADAGFALASGTFLAAGSISFYAALTRGSMAVVSAIAALYFVVPAIVGIAYLDVAVTTTNVVGLVLAAVAVVLIAL